MKKLKYIQIIKHLILAILLLLPFTATLPTIFYFAFNDNAENIAQPQITETTQYNTNDVTTYESIVVGNVYTIKNNFDSQELIRDTSEAITFTVVNGSFKIESYEIGSYTNNNENIETLTMYEMYYNKIYTYNSLIFNEIEILSPIQVNNLTIKIEGLDIWEETTKENLTNLLGKADYLGQVTYEIIENEMSPANAFTTASNEVWKSELFNWVNNSILQVSIGNFVSVFGLSVGSYFNNYITYTLSIVLIYAVINIVLCAVEWLLNLIKRKEN